MVVVGGVRASAPDLCGPPATQRLLLPPPRGIVGGAVQRMNPVVTGAVASRRPPSSLKWLSGIGSQCASGAGSRQSDHDAHHGSFPGAQEDRPTPVSRTFPVPRWSCPIVVAECGVCFSRSLAVAACSDLSVFSPLPFHVRSVIGEAAFPNPLSVLRCVTLRSQASSSGYCVILTRL